jgi:hypothetical protein
MIYIPQLILDYSRVTFLSFFQNEAAAFRDKSQDLKVEAENKQTHVWIYGTPKGALVVLCSTLTDLP